MKNINTYTVYSYDGKIKKEYKGYKCAEKFASKLINQGIYCGIWREEFDVEKFETIHHDCIIGC